MAVVLRSGGRSTSWRVGLLLASLAVAGCQLRLVEEHDPKITQGLTDYQGALETFTLRVLDSYGRCAAARDRLEAVRSAGCAGLPAAGRAACQAQLEAQARDSAALADPPCAAAGADANAATFYFPGEALLRVLVTRARVLDSGGSCTAAVSGIRRLAGSIADPRLRAWMDSAGGGGARNCTETQMRQILANHQLLHALHRQLDGIDAATGAAPAQASVALPLARDTLQQNIEIALFLEEAKKRGAQ